MTIKDVSKETGFTMLFIREWIAQDPHHPFGICVRFPGSERRTFKINEAAFRKWKEGEKV